MIEDGFLLFIRNVRQVLGKDFHGFGDGDIAAVVPTDDVLALHVRDKDGSRDHVVLSVYTKNNKPLQPTDEREG